VIGEKGAIYKGRVRFPFKGGGCKLIRPAAANTRFATNNANPSVVATKNLCQVKSCGHHFAAATAYSLPVGFLGHTAKLLSTPPHQWPELGTYTWKSIGQSIQMPTRGCPARPCIAIVGLMPVFFASPAPHFAESARQMFWVLLPCALVKVWLWVLLVL
jgi:hypothetical protein